MKRADLVLLNANIYTMDEKNPRGTAIALAGDKIIFVGSSEDAKAYITDATVVRELEGKTVLPGLIESHAHVPGSAYIMLYNINLSGVRSKEETLDKIRAFIEAHPERKSYYGKGLIPAHFGGVESALGPRKEHLDKICSDKPVVIADYGGHLKWLNTKALEVYGITKETKVHGGVVEKDPETGELWGILKEEARFLPPDPDYTIEEKVEATKWFQRQFNKFGYTSIMALRPSACADPKPLYDALETMEASGELKLNIFGTREIKASQAPGPQFDDLLLLREKYSNSPLIDVNTAKFFIDGTVEAASAYLLEPFGEAAGKGDHYCGESLWETEELSKWFAASMKAGLNIHVHAIGDAAVSQTIDALEIAEEKVPGEYRNSITHLQVVAPKDIQRMKKHDIIACVNPFWHFKDPDIYFGAELPFLGKDRAEAEYPLASFVNNGVRITSSADDPNSSSPNPFLAIMTGVTRNINNAPFYGEEPITDPDDPRLLLNKEERVSVMEMVKSYTVNAAYANGAEDRVGSLTAGKFADLIVIDRDIFEVAPLEIEKTQVETTIFHGEIVFERENA